MNTRTRPKPAADGETWSPETDEDREAIREQLGRLLASSVFMRSKGCSNLLSYVVNRTLAGDAERLKERTIGVNVFGRAPNYDTACDHVVRSTAGEVRKRLAQYYMEPGRSREIRIDVPPGSYIPHFVAFPDAAVQEQEAIDTASVFVREGGAAVGWGVGRLRSRWAEISVAVAALAVLSMLAIDARMVHSSGRPIDGFWQPLVQSPNPILVCIGVWNQPAQAAEVGPPAQVGSQTAPTSSGGAIRGSEKVFLDDAIALAKFTGWLQQNAKPYRILPPSRVTFADLQTSPAVLIGFNNFWTTSLADRLRFTVERKAPDIAILRDKKNPSRNDWSVNLSTPYDQPTTDYALVVRALDPKTGQIAITAAGLTHFGTRAAGEFLTNPEQLKKLDAYQPNGWEQKNVAIVLSTEVIKGSPGTPKIVATDFW